MKNLVHEYQLIGIESKWCIWKEKAEQIASGKFKNNIHILLNITDVNKQYKDYILKH